ncbi:cysteine hydrolase family protein [Wohlfahrtiimonas populi]|uniref:cysteine hydrolase family protein n=1 Tax=Wohlfahrtiimonas populi TaxID=1940240 RepID=UPI00098D2E02|nr:cysteine hydrolase family protein [Wohlfahrtiimonas populi]
MSELNKKQALLIIDMQNGLFHSNQTPYLKETILTNIQTTMNKARTQNIPIIFFRHVGPEGSPIAPDSALTQIIPELEINRDKDIVLEKTKPSCFYQTRLLDVLAELNVTELVITGMKTDFCIDTTCRVAFEKGIQTTLIADAHTTVDGNGLTAESIIQHHNHVLGAAFSQVVTTDDFNFAQ